MIKGKTTYHTIGCMSGTSLDGLDIAYTIFRHEENQWSFELKECTTISYHALDTAKLANASTINGEELALLDHELGKYIGQEVDKFVKRHNIKPDFIASHGHTVFHQPEKGMTLQIGNIHDIHVQSGIPVIGDFRSLDVALGGHGAPLVPIGDHLLFQEYEYCLNLGGIANISFLENGKRVAFDICPVNMALNLLAQQLGDLYDKNGERARLGKINEELLKQLNDIPFYKQEGPKSLGKEYFDRYFLPLMGSLDTHELLATFVEHAAIQIGRKLRGEGRMLITGGGAHNIFLVERIAHYSKKERVDLFLPEKNIIDFKEAMIFGFLGALHVCKVSNCLASVTGASKDSIGGISIGL